MLNITRPTAHTNTTHGTYARRSSVCCVRRYLHIVCITTQKSYYYVFIHTSMHYSDCPYVECPRMVCGRFWQRPSAGWKCCTLFAPLTQPQASNPTGSHTSASQSRLATRWISEWCGRVVVVVVGIDDCVVLRRPS